MKLNELKAETPAVVTSLGSDPRFIGRITSIGMSEGAEFEVVKNDRKMPVLIYVRETLRRVIGIFGGVCDLHAVHDNRIDDPAASRCSDRKSSQRLGHTSVACVDLLSADTEYALFLRIDGGFCVRRQPYVRNASYNQGDAPGFRGHQALRADQISMPAFAPS